MQNIDDLLLRLEQFQTRPAAILQIRRMGAAAVPALISALDSFQEGVRWSAARLLGEIGGAEALAALEARADDPKISFEVEEAIELIESRAKRSRAAENASPEVMEPQRLLSDAELIGAAADGTEWEVKQVSNGFAITVPLPEGRHQLVRCILQPPSAKHTALVLIYTECGPAPPELYEEALKINLRLPFGAVALRELKDRNIFVMVNSYLRESVTPKDILRSVDRLAREADSLEQELTPAQDAN